MICHVNLVIELLNVGMLLWLARKVRAQNRRISVLKVLSARQGRDQGDTPRAARADQRS